MKPGTILLLGLLFLTMISIGFSFYQYYVAHNYLVVANVVCDSSIHSCFVGDGTDAPLLYEVVTKPAYEIPKCSEYSGNCPQLSCSVGDTKCSVTFCEAGGDTTCQGPGK